MAILDSVESININEIRGWFVSVNNNNLVECLGSFQDTVIESKNFPIRNIFWYQGWIILHEPKPKKKDDFFLVSKFNSEGLTLQDFKSKAQRHFLPA